MGTYLSTPVTDQHDESGENAQLAWGVVDMQGWRKSMEDAHVVSTVYTPPPPHSPAPPPTATAPLISTTIPSSSSSSSYNVGETGEIGIHGIFGVFDGHGGPEVARFCQLYLVSVLQHHYYHLCHHSNSLHDSSLFTSSPPYSQQQRNHHHRRQRDKAAASSNTSTLSSSSSTFDSSIGYQNNNASTSLLSSPSSATVFHSACSSISSFSHTPYYATGLPVDAKDTDIGQTLVHTFHALDRMIGDPHRRQELTLLRSSKPGPGEQLEARTIPPPPPGHGGQVGLGSMSGMSSINRSGGRHNTSTTTPTMMGRSPPSSPTTSTSSSLSNNNNYYHHPSHTKKSKKAASSTAAMIENDDDEDNDDEASDETQGNETSMMDHDEYDFDEDQVELSTEDVVVHSNDDHDNNNDDDDGGVVRVDISPAAENFSSMSSNSSKVSVMFQRLLKMSAPAAATAGQFVLPLPDGTTSQPGSSSSSPFSSSTTAAAAAGMYSSSSLAALPPPGSPSKSPVVSSPPPPSLIRNGRLICNLPEHPIHAGATAIVVILWKHDVIHHENNPDETMKDHHDTTHFNDGDTTTTTSSTTGGTIATSPRTTTRTILTVANAGDSRAVLGRRMTHGMMTSAVSTTTTTITAVALSFDHKPLHEVELTRIRNAGGFVNHFGRVNGNLNLSRSIGDLKYKQGVHLAPSEQMITAEPDIVQVEIGDNDEFFLLGCDGIWDCLTNEKAVAYVRSRIDTMSPTAIGSQMLKDILSEDPRTTQGIGGDNMTIMIVDLQPWKRSWRTQGTIPSRSIFPPHPE